jgi:hypothetical protein
MDVAKTIQGIMIQYPGFSPPSLPSLGNGNPSLPHPLIPSSLHPLTFAPHHTHTDRGHPSRYIRR